MADFLNSNEQEVILDYVYSNFNTEEHLGLTSQQLQMIHENIRGNPLSISQIEASMNYVCACCLLCDREEMLDVLKEMDRRYYLAADLQWEFALLDRQRKGTITKSNAMFLFQMLHGEYFSKYKFDRLIQVRLTPECDISFEEIEVELCNIPTHDWIDDMMKEEIKESEEKEFKRRIEERRQREILNKKQKEEEMQQLLEEEAKNMKKVLALKAIQEEKMQKQKAEEDKAKQEQAALVQKKLDEEKAAKRERKRLKEQELKKRREAKEKEEADENAKQLLEEANALKLAEEKLIEDKAAEQKRKAEEEEAIRDAHEQLLLKKEEEEEYKAELIRLKEEEEEKQANVQKELDNEHALDSWKKAKVLVKEKVRNNRVEALHESKAKHDAIEAAKEVENANEASVAETRAEEELEQAGLSLKQATSEEEKLKAEEAMVKASEEALRFKEKRLRLTLKAAVKLRNKPRIDVAVTEAKESEIKALQPDIAIAEKVSESLKCGEELEDAMVKRDLHQIEASVEKIKAKGFAKDHAVAITEAQKLVEKLKRIEKLKKEILALDQRTIAEIRSYKTPNPAIHQVMIATYIILGYKEKELKEWKFIQALLGRSGKEGLKRMCTTIEASKINLTAAALAEQKYLRKHSIQSITEISAGGGTFFVWSTAMIDEARSWNEDSEFREKVEEKRRKEEEETKRLKEEKLKKQAKVVKPTNDSSSRARKTTQRKNPADAASTKRSRSIDPKSKSGQSGKMAVPQPKNRSKSGSPKTKRK